MNQWRVTGANFDAASRAVFTVTKGSRCLDHREQNELEALLAGWQPIESAPRDGTEIILRRGNRVTTGSLIVWGSKRPDYDERGNHIGEREQKSGALWATVDGGFTADEPPTSWMPL